MSLNDTAATEVMGWEIVDGTVPRSPMPYPHLSRAAGCLLLHESAVMIPKRDFAPDSNYSDAMLVRDKAVERYAEWIEEPGVSKDACIANARENFVKELGGLDMHRTSLVFASPAQITEASIALVRRME